MPKGMYVVFTKLQDPSGTRVQPLVQSHPYRRLDQAKGSTGATPLPQRAAGAGQGQYLVLYHFRPPGPAELRRRLGS